MYNCCLIKELGKIENTILLKRGLTTTYRKYSFYGFCIDCSRSRLFNDRSIS